MLSNLKNMVKNNNLASVILIFDEGDITLRRQWSEYKVILEGEDGFEEHKVSENNFFKYLENGIKKIAFSGEFRIANTVKTDTICSFLVKRV